MAWPPRLGLQGWSLGGAGADLRSLLDDDAERVAVAEFHGCVKGGADIDEGDFDRLLASEEAPGVAGWDDEEGFGSDHGVGLLVCSLL